MLLRPIIEVVQDFLFVKDGDAIGVIVDADSLQHKAYPLGYSCCSRHCVVFVHVRSTSQDADAELLVFSGSLVCGFLAKPRSHRAVVPWHHPPASRRLTSLICIFVMIQNLNPHACPASDGRVKHIRLGKSTDAPSCHMPLFV